MQLNSTCLGGVTATGPLALGAFRGKSNAPQLPPNEVLTIRPVGTSSYTSSTPPTFGTDFVTFTHPQQSFINWGTHTFNLGTIGFSAKMKIVWTDYNSWAVFLISIVGNFGIQDMFLTIPGTLQGPLRFQYRENGAEQITDYNTTIQLHTIYNISIVYNPNIGGTGRTEIWVNCSMVVRNENMQYKAIDKSFTNTYVGKSSFVGDDMFLGAKIYFLNVYNRVLTNAEAAAIF